MKVDGRCHCGAITYEAVVTPGTATICHCTDCQRQSGTAFRTNIATAAKDFRLLTGTPKTYLKIADSGARRIHAFCDICGGPVYACAETDPRTYSLRIGALEQRHALGRPQRQIWTRRRIAWLPALDGVDEIDGQP